MARRLAMEPGVQTHGLYYYILVYNLAIEITIFKLLF